MVLFNKFEHLVNGFIGLWHNETEVTLRELMEMKLIQPGEDEGVVDLPVVLWTRKEVSFTTDEGDLEPRDFVPLVLWWSILTILFLVEFCTFVVELFEFVGCQNLSIVVQAFVAAAGGEELHIGLHSF